MVKQNQFIGYVGTYTKGASEGIYSFTLDTKASKITDVKVAVKIDNPTYLTISNDNQFLYAVAKEGSLGGVAAFSMAGEITEVNRQLAEGAPPCHVTVDSRNHYLFSGNYHKGTVNAYNLNEENGAINPNPAIAQHEGSGPDDRQEKPHTHYAGFTPDEKYVAAIDLGIDQLITYELVDGALTEVSRLTVKPGSGPRHLVFHPNGEIAYLMTEFSSEVLVLRYNAENGHFTQLQAISTIPDDFNENNQGSAIHISNDGRFVYAANRGHDSIAIFSVNEETFELTFVDRAHTEGNWPRDFALDPTNQFLVASNQESSNIVLFSRDSDSGKLTLLDSDIVVPDPVCVKFLNS